LCQFLNIIIRHLDNDREVYSSCRLLVFYQARVKREETSMPKPPPTNPLIPNRLLAQLPAQDYERLAPHLKPVILKNKQVLYDVGQPINYVYFPIKAMISVVVLMENGMPAEAGLIGHEGMTGIAAILGQRTASQRNIVQSPDGALRLETKRLKDECDRGGALQGLLLGYLHSFLLQVSQTAGCNGRHRLEERLARWLLMVEDRVQSSEFFLTQEFISQMLGVYRPGVSIAAHTLHQAGLIDYQRGKIKVLNRQGLEDSACECYQAVRLNGRPT